VHPRLFQFGYLAIPTYGVLAAAGLVAALLLARALARVSGIDADKVWNLGLIGILTALFGSKLLLIFLNWSDFRAHPLWMLGLTTIRSGGIFAGGLALALLAGLVYARYSHLPLRRTMDVAAPALALGHAIGRLGCFAAGCCYGRPTTMPWGVTFSSRMAALWSGTPLHVRLHPTQLYESVVEFVLFFLLTWLLLHRESAATQVPSALVLRNGEIMGAWLFLYGVARFFIEFYRGDPGRGSIFGGMLTVTQLIAVGMVVAGGLLWIQTRPEAEISHA
jgi:phosphatidylglycerol---prolipoprotein diacylglyceryl transferase